ncbi:MAG: hypothetical protein AB7S26_09295 [Sandaracinaceae bacterium]
MSSRAHRSLFVATALSFLTAALVTAGYAPIASAQCEAEPEPDAVTRAAARPYYNEGIEASTQSRWAEARRSFARAADITPLSPIVYNLATAQSHTGLIVEAAENYRLFLRRCASSQTPDLREEAEQLLAQIAPRVGRLTLRVDNLDESVDRVLIDDSVVAHALIGTDMPANPGTRQLRIERNGQVIERRSFDIREGRASTMLIALPRYERPTPPGGGGGDVDVGLVVGLSIGAVALLAGAATIILVVLLGQQGLEFPCGSFDCRTAQVPLIEF